MVKNLKHGLKVTKRDVVLETRYFVFFNHRILVQAFNTKLDAVNFISEYLFYHSDEKDNFTLIRTQSLKF